jgi:hypothetical protein
MAILADNLLNGVKRRCILPSNQAVIEDTDVLAIADSIVSSEIIPLLESINQEYFVTTSTSSLVASQSVYPIPYRAIGRTIRELKIVDTNNYVRNVAQIALEDAHVYDANTTTIGFYFIGDQIRLVPDVPSTLSISQSLQFWWRMPPNSLCASTSAAQVTSIGSTTINVSSVPSNLTVGSSIDFIQGKSGSSIYSIDQTITNIAGTTITFGASVIPTTAPNALAVGDYISLAGTSPVLNFIPNECYSYFETLVCERVLQSIGDFDGAMVLAPIIGREKENILKILSPRIDGEPIIIINRSGLVRGNKFAQRRWLYGS